jgi:hypothetical protein
MRYPDPQRAEIMRALKPLLGLALAPPNRRRGQALLLFGAPRAVRRDRTKHDRTKKNAFPTGPAQGRRLASGPVYLR